MLPIACAFFQNKWHAYQVRKLSLIRSLPKSFTSIFVSKCHTRDVSSNIEFNTLGSTRTRIATTTSTFSAIERHYVDVQRHRTDGSCITRAKFNIDGTANETSVWNSRHRYGNTDSTASTANFDVGTGEREAFPRRSLSAATLHSSVVNCFHFATPAILRDYFR